MKKPVIRLWISIVFLFIWNLIRWGFKYADSYLQLPSIGKMRGDPTGNLWRVLFSICMMSSIVLLLSNLVSTAKNSKSQIYIRLTRMGFFLLLGYLPLGIAARVHPYILLDFTERLIFLTLLACLLLTLLVNPSSTKTIQELFEKLKTQKPFILTSFAALLSLSLGAIQARFSYQRACLQWPFCASSYASLTVGDALYLIHLIGIGVTGIMLAWLLKTTWREHAANSRILVSATAASALFTGQILIGAVRVPAPNPGLWMLLHAQTPLIVWAALVFATGFAALEPAAKRGFTQENDLLPNRSINRKRSISDFVALTKPLIAALLLFTTLTGMVLAQEGIPDPGLIFYTLLAGALAAGGSGAINHTIDRDLDIQMTRTANRPIASGRLYRSEGLAFGFGLLILAFFLMARFVNLNAALLSLAGMVYYLLVYSLVLKRKTVWNIVIGGGAGAIPPLVGWSAVTGNLDYLALSLFVIVFLWTPTHFWSLALVRQPEYAAASVPMLPVVKGRRQTIQHILVSALLLVGFSWLISFFGPLAQVYRFSALLSGSALLFFAVRLWIKDDNRRAHLLFRFSNMYLGVLFLAIMLDVFIK